MDELTTAIERTRHTVDPAWDAARTRRAHEAFSARVERRRRTRLTIAIAAPAVTLVAVALLVLRGQPVEPERGVGVHAHPAPQMEVAGAGQPLRFWDGSSATPVGDAGLRASEVTPSRIVVDVEHGGARFDVTPGLRERAFLVRMHGVTVRVVGTSFTVSGEGQRTRVAVEHGRVQVEWNGGSAALAGGEEGVFPPGEQAAAAPADLDEAPEAAQERPERNWRRLAESGDFGGAFEALSRAEVRDRPEELLLAADAARLSNHPREALTYYQRVVRDHASDPRAPLAAFTMGRVLLTQLGRPREAATAFARARALAGGGSIAEDALAREVEARALAGDTERARALAEEYAARYPSGQRLRAVRRFGGLP